MKTVQKNGVTQLQAEENGYIITTEEKSIEEVVLMKSVNLIGTLTEVDFRDATAEEIAEVQARIEAEKQEYESNL